MLKFLLHLTNRNFLRLFLAQLISQFGDRINQLALIGLIAQRSPGSAMGLAKVMAFTIIPVFFIQPFAGALVDRWDRRNTLLFCDIIRGFLVLSIPWAMTRQDSMIPIYIVVFFVFCFSRFYVPAKMSIIPDLVNEEYLLTANSLVTTTGMIAFVLGCALGGFIIEKFGPANGFLIDAATYFVSGFFVFSIRRPIKLHLNRERIFKAGREILSVVQKSIWSEIREGFQYLFKQRDIRFIVYIFFIILAAAGAVYVVLIVFIQEAFHSITKDLGVLAVCLGVGLFLGVIAYGKWGHKIPWFKTIFYCLISGGLMLIVFARLVHLYPNMHMAMILSGMLGFIIGPIFIASNTVIQIVSDEKMRGKVFSSMEIVIHIAFLTAMLASSWLSQYVKSVWILIGVGVLFAVIGSIGLFKTQHKNDLAFINGKMA